MKKIFTSVAIVGFAISLSSAQTDAESAQTPSAKQKKSIAKLSEKAAEHYEHAAFMESAQYYEELEHAGEVDASTRAKLAESYRCNADYEKAEYWYRQYVSEGTDPQTCLNFAKVLQANDKCEEASQWYRRYLATDPIDAEDIELLADCENLKAIAYNDEVLFYNLEEVNTTASEYSTMRFKDQLVFTSNRNVYKPSKRQDQWTEGEFSDLFMATSDKFGAYSEVERMRGSINKKYHDGVSAFDNSEFRMYFTRNENKSGKNKNIRELQIFSAKIGTDGVWHDVVKMPFNVPGYSSCHPTISSDGSTMVFASDRPGGYGGMDLYITHKVDEVWSTPKNLGKRINSPNNEIFPSITKTNDIFFASNGHVGLGGLDIFRAHREDKKLNAGESWEIENIGKPFNSIKDDFSFTMADDGLSGYLASNREGGVGKDDIYRWVRKSDDPIVLDWYKKSLCLEHLYEEAPIHDATITLLEFMGITNSDDNNTVNMGIIEKQEDKIKTTVENIVALRNSRLVNASSFNANDPLYQEFRMKPNRDYLFIVEKEGFLTSQKLVTADQNAAVYAPCIELNLEPYNLLSAHVELENKEESLRKVGVSLFNHCSKKEEVIALNADGDFTYKLKCDCTYDLKIEQEGYFTYEKQLKNFIEECGKQQETLEIVLKSTNPFAGRIKKGEVVTLRNILYDYNSADLTKEAQTELNHLLETLRTYPSMKIHLSSFTDSRGKPEYNMKLSESRAKSAAFYLISNGVDETRIQFIGMGENKLLNDCTDGVECSESEHQINRRTEVKILSI